MRTTLASEYAQTHDVLSQATVSSGQLSIKGASSKPPKFGDHTDTAEEPYSRFIRFGGVFWSQACPLVASPLNSARTIAKLRRHVAN
jgi:hypothetical protein